MFETLFTQGVLTIAVILTSFRAISFTTDPSEHYDCVFLAYKNIKRIPQIIEQHWNRGHRGIYPNQSIDQYF